MKMEEAKAALKLLIKPGDTVYTILRHTSKSGHRHISVFAVVDGKVEDISHQVSLALGYPRADDGGVVCGCDGGGLVTVLSYSLHNSDVLGHVWL